MAKAFNKYGYKVITLVPPKYDAPLDNFTPADQGIIAATLDDAKAQGLGDDDTVDMLAVALRFNKISMMRSWTARDTAYYIVHG